jgi:hypothetical protein
MLEDENLFPSGCVWLRDIRLKVLPLANNYGTWCEHRSRSLTFSHSTGKLTDWTVPWTGHRSIQEALWCFIESNPVIFCFDAPKVPFSPRKYKRKSTISVMICKWASRNEPKTCNTWWQFYVKHRVALLRATQGGSFTYSTVWQF